MTAFMSLVLAGLSTRMMVVLPPFQPDHVSSNFPKRVQQWEQLYTLGQKFRIDWRTMQSINCPFDGYLRASESSGWFNW